MQQDWKAIWDNLNPDEAAKERMKQAILQKMQAETPQTASKKPPFFLQRCSFGTFTRAAALCCMTVTVALAGLHLTGPPDGRIIARTIRQRTAGGNHHTAHFAGTDNGDVTDASYNKNTNTNCPANNGYSQADGYQSGNDGTNSCIISGSHRKTRCRNRRTVKKTDSDRANLYRTRTRSHNNSCGNKCNRSTRNHDHHNIPWS